MNYAVQVTSIVVHIILCLKQTNQDFYSHCNQETAKSNTLILDSVINKITNTSETGHQSDIQIKA